MKKKVLLTAVVWVAILAGGGLGAWLFAASSASSQPKAQEITLPKRSSYSDIKTFNDQPVQEVTYPSGVKRKVVAGEIMVVITNDATVKSLGGSIAPAGIPQTYTYHTKSGEDLMQAAKDLKKLPGVDSAEPNAVYAAQGGSAPDSPNDPEFTGNWQVNLADISAGGAWDIDNSTAAPATLLGADIAILDTGVQPNNAELQGKFLTSPSGNTASKFPGVNTYLNDNFGMDFHNPGRFDSATQNWRNNPNGKGADDVYGHGTSVASVAAANTNNGIGIAGVSPAARILPVRVGDAKGSASDASFVAGIYYALSRNVKVLNFSFGGQCKYTDGTLTKDDQCTSAVVKRAFNEIQRQKAIIIVSSGDEQVNGVDSPASNAGATNTETNSKTGAKTSYRSPVLAIGGTAPYSINRAVGKRFYSWSNGKKYAVESGATYGKQLTLSAPYMTWAAYCPYCTLKAESKSNDYDLFAGTSASAPLVTGVVSMMLALQPNLTSDQIINILTATSDKPPGGRNIDVGAGRLNAAKALQYVKDNCM